MKIIEDSGGTVKYKSPAVSKTPNWLLQLIGLHWDDRIKVSILGGDSAFPEFQFRPDLQLAQLHNLRNIDEIYITGDIADDLLKYLADIHEVKRLYITGTLINGEGLKHLKGMKNLQLLHLSDSRITDSNLRYIQDIISLEHLNLDESNVTDKGLKYLKNLTQLRELSLFGTKVNGTGLIELNKL